jgi:NO-binding membrane sensor protein with MHYT domain
MTGGNHTLLSVDYWTFGLLTPGIGFVVSFLGAFLGLRCASRAHACRGVSRATWLVLGGVAIGALGLWAMDFIALLGFTIRDETIRYSVPATALSLLVAVAIMCGCLLVVGFGRGRSGWLLTGGLVTGIGVAVMHYLVMATLRMPAQIAYAPGPMIASVVIAIGAATALMWAVTRLRALWHTVLAAFITAVAVSTMHYVTMAAVRLYQAPGPAPVAQAGGGGVTVQTLLLPLIIGITVVAFLVGSVIALSPTPDAIRYDESLLDDIRRHADSSLAVTPLPLETAGRHLAAPRSSPPWTFAELRPPSPSPAISGRGDPRRY